MSAIAELNDASNNHSLHHCAVWFVLELVKKHHGMQIYGSRPQQWHIRDDSHHIAILELRDAAQINNISKNRISGAELHM